MMHNQSLKDRVRAFSGRYSIPIIYSAMLLSAMYYLSLAAIFVGPLGWTFATIGSVTASSAMTLVGYGVPCKADLLRIERESITALWVDRA